MAVNHDLHVICQKISTITMHGVEALSRGGWILDSSSLLSMSCPDRLPLRLPEVLL